MSSAITNLGNLLFLVFVGPWQVAPWPPLILVALIVFAVALHRTLPRMNGFLLGACISMAAAALHIAIVIGLNGIGPLVGLGFVAAIIAFYPISMVFVLIVRSWKARSSTPGLKSLHSVGRRQRSERD